MIMSTLVSLLFIPLNLWYWWRGMGRWQDAFRRRCERRYNVTFTFGGKGHWQVVERIPWHKRFAIEQLQLVYFLALFLGWALGLGAGALLLWLLGKLGLPQVIG